MPESLDAAEHRCAGHSFLTSALDDRLVQGLAVPRVGLADVDPEQLAAALEIHSALPAHVPAYTASSPAPTLARTFTAASNTAPSSARRIVSNAKVENVVYAPRKPTVSAMRSVGCGRNRSVISAKMNPSAKQPDTLITSVSQGNTPAMCSLMKPPSEYRAIAPKKPAMPTHIIRTCPPSTKKAPTVTGRSHQRPWPRLRRAPSPAAR